MVNDAITNSFCTFRVGQRLYGIEVSSLQEVSTSLDITPVPPAPATVRGLANLRSRVFLILDLRPLLGLEPIECTVDSRILILKSNVAQDTGVLVDGGGDIVAVPRDRMENTTTSELPREDKGTPLVETICKLDDELLIIVDVQNLESRVARLIG